jgi:hypothetical protein
MDWNTLVADGEDALKAAIGSVEGLQLEFKGDDPKSPMFYGGKLTDHGRKTIGRELSAFSNSAGGILIIGVDCRRIGEVDQAQALKPIPDIDKAFGAVGNAIGELLQPKHDSIDIHLVRATADGNTGYLAINVPRSDRRPHRCEAKDQKQYFKRAGSSAFAMEHYDIEDAFRRISAPVLTLQTAFHFRMKSGDKIEMLLDLAFENEGEVSAKFVCAELFDMVGPALKFSSSIGGSGGTVVSRFGETTTLSASQDFVVHPGQTRKLYEIGFTIGLEDRHTPKIAGKVPTVGDVWFQYLIGAEDMRAIRGTYQLDRTELEKLKAAIDR